MKGVSARLRVVVAVEQSLLGDLGRSEEGGVGSHHVHLVGGEHVNLTVPRTSRHVEDKVAAVRRSEQVSPIYTFLCDERFFLISRKFHLNYV